MTAVFKGGMPGNINAQVYFETHINRAGTSYPKGSNTLPSHKPAKMFVFDVCHDNEDDKTISYLS